MMCTLLHIHLTALDSVFTTHQLERIFYSPLNLMTIKSRSQIGNTFNNKESFSPRKYFMNL